MDDEFYQGSDALEPGFYDDFGICEHAVGTAEEYLTTTRWVLPEEFRDLSLDRLETLARIPHPAGNQWLDRVYRYAIFTYYVDCCEAGAGDEANAVLRAYCGSPLARSFVAGAERHVSIS